MRPGRAAARTEPAQDGALVDFLAFLDQSFRHVGVAGGEPVAMINLDHDSVAAYESGVHDAASGGGADFRSVSLGEIDAWVQRKAAEERIGPIAEGRREAGI